MAIEAKRGCGYRKVGGLYLVSGNLMAPCCKLPILLKICPCCGNGIKQTRGWTWIDPRQWLKDDCKSPSGRGGTCPASNPAAMGDKVGLLWIGTQFYPTVESFAEEANKLGISRRINSVPRGFEVGKHYVFFAHPKVKQETDAETGETKWVPGIFQIFRPTRIEKIITETMSKDEKLMEDLIKRNILPVIVPDDDKDHQGSVYDPKKKRDEEDEDELELT